jgi:hypothetical protein
MKSSNLHSILAICIFRILLSSCPGAQLCGKDAPALFGPEMAEANGKDPCRYSRVIVQSCDDVVARQLHCFCNCRLTGFLKRPFGPSFALIV